MKKQKMIVPSRREMNLIILVLVLSSNNKLADCIEKHIQYMSLSAPYDAIPVASELDQISEHPFDGMMVDQQSFQQQQENEQQQREENEQLQHPHQQHHQHQQQQQQIHHQQQQLHKQQQQIHQQQQQQQQQQQHQQPQEMHESELDMEQQEQFGAMSDAPDQQVESVEADQVEELNTGMDTISMAPSSNTTPSDGPNLPTQYDSMLLLPPEGYYDDYFKPIPSNAGASLLNPTEPPERMPEMSSGGNLWPDDVVSTNLSVASLTNLTDPPEMVSTPTNSNVWATENEVSSLNEGSSMMNAPPDPPETGSTPSNSNTWATEEQANSGRPVNSASTLNLTERAPAQHNDGHNWPADDGVQLIIANTTRDPSNNEKVINYLSEGPGLRRRTPGQPVRDTFVNKDMNEYPPVDSGHQQQQQNQQTICRPQVTQVNFNPKELILNPPTAAPIDAESTMENLSKLPAKMKKIRETQPDKNELMNELLTALDRVKVAIYKLQPLTAKMNAIYRKSVTSNTRDIVMDNNKGTYAKRYPPGDYDDSYDKLRPSDLLNQQENMRKRNTRSSGKRGKTQAQQHSRQATGSSRNLRGSESIANPVYLPAPKEILERYEQMNETNTVDSRKTEDDSEEKGSSDGLHLVESEQVVAAGFGRRLGSGRGGNRHNISHNGFQPSSYDDNLKVESSQSPQLVSKKYGNSSDHGFESDHREFVLNDKTSDIEEGETADENQSPMFGYRITVFQNPEYQATNADGEFSEVDEGEPGEQGFKEQFSYEIDGLTGAIERLDVNNNNNEPESDSSTAGTTLTTASSVSQDLDSMVTSESSISEQQQQQQPTGLASQSISGSYQNNNVDLKASASWANKEKLKKSKGGGNEEKLEKEEKEEGKKKGEASKKSAMRKKKMEEEKKKKKEYKKIKHNKGIVSKEKKVMHRDKHIKAHDRGAAKEKALKERTQIEFFEREQIVDDEFEKGKKSTMKANWQVGHDSKKTIKDNHNMHTGGGGSHDPMSSAGSNEHLIAQESKNEKDHESEKGIALGAKSEKKSHKFEKKKMDAKGKKFKGWREKGYKIITETEFIDRGSLHDSAYKKRDKGGAHHQKFKKHHSSSEGHHGSMHESHKKSSKKEEKKSKQHEKKATHSKKMEKEKDGSKEGKSASEKKINHSSGKHSGGHDKSMSSSNEEPSSTPSNSNDYEFPALSDGLESKESPSILQNLAYNSDGQTGGSERRKYPLSRLSAKNDQQMLTSANSINPAVLSSERGNKTLSRLLNLTNNDHPLQYSGFSTRAMLNNDTNHHNVTLMNSGERGNLSVLHQADLQPLENSSATELPLNRSPYLFPYSKSRSNLSSVSNNKQNLSKIPLHSSSGEYNERGSPIMNATTILDIVDNMTGRQLNKTKIGTYELEDNHQNNSARVLTPRGFINTHNNINNTNQAISPNKMFVVSSLQHSSTTTTAPTGNLNSSPSANQQYTDQNDYNNRTTAMPSKSTVVQSQMTSLRTNESLNKQRREFMDQKHSAFDAKLGETLLLDLLRGSQMQPRIQQQPQVFNLGNPSSQQKQLSHSELDPNTHVRLQPSNQFKKITTQKDQHERPLQGLNNYFTPDQTNAAAQFLRFIHKASQQHQNLAPAPAVASLINSPVPTSSGSFLENSLPAMDYNRHNLNLVPSRQQSPYMHQRQVLNSRASSPSSTLNALLTPGNAGVRNFNHEVDRPFIDYDQDTLASFTPNNFLTDK